MSVTLAQASTIVDVALKKARDSNLAPLTVAVLDAGGHFVAFKREDKSGLLRFDIAFGKAWGALGMGFGSRTLARMRPFAISAATSSSCRAARSRPLSAKARMSGWSAPGKCGAAAPASRGKR